MTTATTASRFDHTIAIANAVHSLRACRMQAAWRKCGPTLYRTALALLDRATVEGASERDYLFCVEALANGVEQMISMQSATTQHTARAALATIDRALNALETLYAAQRRAA